MAVGDGVDSLDFKGKGKGKSKQKPISRTNEPKKKIYLSICLSHCLISLPAPERLTSTTLKPERKREKVNKISLSRSRKHFILDQINT